MRNDPFPGRVFLSSCPPLLSLVIESGTPAPATSPGSVNGISTGIEMGFHFIFFRTSINIFFSFKFLDDLKEFRSWFIEISEQILEICL